MVKTNKMNGIISYGKIHKVGGSMMIALSPMVVKILEVDKDEVFIIKGEIRRVK